MKKCPKCNQMTLEYDEYFKRYRCFNPFCGWMPSSNVERELKLFEASKQPKEIFKQKISEVGLELTVLYDGANDAIIFDFGFNEQSFEVPEPDGIMIWSIGKFTGSIVGFKVLEAERSGISKIRVDIVSKISKITSIENMSKSNINISSGNKQRMMIEQIKVFVESRNKIRNVSEEKLKQAVEEAFNEVEHYLLDNVTRELEQSV